LVPSPGRPTSMKPVSPTPVRCMCKSDFQVCRHAHVHIGESHSVTALEGRGLFEV
jgi:hypothetical protein